MLRCFLALCLSVLIAAPSFGGIILNSEYHVDQQGATYSYDNGESVPGSIDRTLNLPNAIYEFDLGDTSSDVYELGGAIAASSAMHAEIEQGRVNELIAQWLEEHREKINLLGNTIQGIANRLDNIDGEMAEAVERRLNDEKYLSLVRRGFRAWDRSDTNEKRDYVRRCLTNAACTKICSDDVIRLFLDWIDKYDEMHFAVIRALYNNRGATRAYIWDEIHGEKVREDSSEADLYKLLIFDLNTGRVLRQIRDKNSHGQFLSKRRKSTGQRKPVLESAFENSKPYELTALGGQFVHYAMNEVAPRLDSTI